jgi:cysteine desulfurase
MTTIYFDNAATTPIDPEVKGAMISAMDDFGNPSSVHALGRKSKSIIEAARKLICTELNCHPGEITFTSGGTEADNLAILGVMESGKIQHIISSKIEHPAVLESIKKAESQFEAKVHWVNFSDKGEIDLNHLESLLFEKSQALVSLMHVNNEIGSVLDVNRVGALCKEYNAIFHTDTVQSVGHFKFDLSEQPIDLLTGSAHKLNGPKGVGFLYHRKGVSIAPQTYGGKQERELRTGTENVVGIAGLGKSIELVYSNFDTINAHLTSLKTYLISELKKVQPNVVFNGNSGNIENSQNGIVNIHFPHLAQNDMLLFQLDLKGILVSGGSACNSGSVSGSPVLGQLGIEGANLRVSFGRSNTKEEIDRFIEVIAFID